MPCTYPITDFSDIQYACNVAFGGIKKVDIEGTDAAGTKTKVNIEFNPSDAFSNASEVKTVSADGTVSVAQTLQVEIPRISKEKYEAVDSFRNPNFELKVFITTKAGCIITYGAEYGCFLSLIDASSGSGRKDKNRIQLTFTGDESKLAPVEDSAAVAAMYADGSMTDIIEDEDEAPVTRKRRIIEVED